jgi:type IV secretion system protein VirD4
MGWFSKSEKSKDAFVPDKILVDLPRGEEGRLRHESFLPRVYFEAPDELARIGFQENSADIYLGVVNGSTTPRQRPDGRYEYITAQGVPVGIRDDRHMTTVAGSRSGKGRSAIIPNLLTYGGSVLVIDPKGENASITATYRAETLGQKVFVLDPFGITALTCGKYRKRFNPLSLLLRLDNLTVIEDAALLADALVVPGGGEDTHWDESAKAFLEGLILHVATSSLFKDEERTLVTVADLLAGRIKPFTELLADMLDNESLDHHIIASARSMQEKADKELASVLSTARKNLRFLQYDSMRDVLSGHDFDLEGLLGDRMTVYLVLPAIRMGTCSQWLRLFINLTLAATENHSGKPKIPALMILDEFAVLGRMQELERAIGQIAGLGLRIWTILQDMGQLKALYKDRWETFLGNSGVIQCFGNVDHFTSNWISRYLDKTTITVTDVNATTIDQKHKDGISGQSEKQQVQDLMTAAEVRRYFARDDRFNRQLVLIPGRRPFILQRAAYDQHSLFAGRFGAFRNS